MATVAAIFVVALAVLPATATTWDLRSPDGPAPPPSFPPSSPSPDTSSSSPNYDAPPPQTDQSSPESWGPISAPPLSSPSAGYVAPQPSDYIYSPAPAPTPSDYNLASVGPVPVSNLKLGSDRYVGGTLQGFLEYDDGKGNRYRLCSKNTFFNGFSASLACQYFGNGAGGMRVSSVPYLRSAPKVPRASLPFFHCNNTATALAGCTAGALIVDPACPDEDIIYIKCYGEGALRLVDGPTPDQGRLQILINGRWYNTCSDNIKGVTANTACRLMGFPTNNASRLNSSVYDTRNKRVDEPNVWLPYIACNGNENTFRSCLHARGADIYGNIGASENCYPTRADAALVCGDWNKAAEARRRNGTYNAGARTAVMLGLQLAAAALAAAMVLL